MTENSDNLKIIIELASNQGAMQERSETLKAQNDQLSVEKAQLTDENNRLKEELAYMKEALNFIEGNYQRDISIEEIADKSGLNRSYFSRLFKETFGESPQSFLIKYRMNKASEMLKNSRIPIADVGRNVGYENQLHFSRAFRNIFGISPREYRDRNMVHPQQV